MSYTMEEKREEKPRPIDDILQSNIWDVDYEPHIKVEYESPKTASTTRKHPTTNHRNHQKIIK